MRALAPEVRLFNVSFCYQKQSGFGLGALEASLAKPEEAAEKPVEQKSNTSGAKSPSYSQSFTARLKPCPDTKQEFFRSLKNRALRTYPFTSSHTDSKSPSYSQSFTARLKSCPNTNMLFPRLFSCVEEVIFSACL
jgi:hypothetical protein